MCEPLRITVTKKVNILIQAGSCAHIDIWN